MGESDIVQVPDFESFLVITTRNRIISWLDRLALDARDSLIWICRALDSSPFVLTNVVC